MDTTNGRRGPAGPTEIARARSAALRAPALHPGPVGELLARELRAYADFGHRFGADGLVERLAALLLDGRPAAGLREPAA